MDNRSWNLLDEALGVEQQRSKNGRFVLIEDCVETNGAFILHHLIKQSLSAAKTTTTTTTNSIIFVSFAQPFSHYDRILRKLGCNLAAQRDNGKFIFIDMLKLDSLGEGDGNTKESWLVALYGNIRKAVEALTLPDKKCVSIMIDDLSLMEVAACGSSNDVLNFLHYFHTLTSEFGCSLFVLNHGDIYPSTNGPTFHLQMKYLADLFISIEPLTTGLASDVHGQLTILNKRLGDLRQIPRKNAYNFHFKVKENSIDCFYPGSRS